MRQFQKLASIVVCILLANITVADEVPKNARGVWSLGSCGSDRAAMLVTSDFALLFEGTGEQVVTMGPVKWTGDAAVLWRFDKPMILPPMASMKKCPNLPPSAYATLGEAIAFLNLYDQIAQVCRTDDGRECAESLFSFADVSRDSKLSLAEVSRVLRVVGMFATYEGIVQESASSGNASLKVPVLTLTGSSMFVSLLAPMVTRNLVASYDYDGDSFISLQEIMQDREPLLDHSLEGAAGTVIGIASVQGVMSEAVSVAIGNAKDLLGTFGRGALFR